MRENPNENKVGFISNTSQILKIPHNNECAKHKGRRMSDHLLDLEIIFVKFEDYQVNSKFKKLFS